MKTKKQQVFFWALFSILSATSVIPWIFFDYPAMGDHANHLARLHLTTESKTNQWTSFYYINNQIIPNLGQEIFCIPLVSVGAPPELALNIFIATAILLQAWSAVALAYRIWGTIPWMALWCFVFAQSRYLLWGFLNFEFALGLAFVSFFFWIHAQSKKTFFDRAVWLFFCATLLVAALLSHMIGWGIGVSLIGFWCISEYIKSGTYLRQWIRLGVQMLSATLPSLMAYALSTQKGADLTPHYAEFLKGKIGGVASAFATYHTATTLITCAAFIFSVGWALRNTRFPALREYLAAQIVPFGIFAIFLLSPGSMMGSYFLDRRIFVPALMMSLIFLPNKENYHSKIPWLLVLALLVTHTVRFSEFFIENKQQTKVVREIREALQTIPPKSILVGFNFTDSGRLEAPALGSVINLAVPDRGAFVPGLFAEPRDRMPISVRKEIIAQNAKYTHPLLDSNSESQNLVDWKNFCGAGDYVLITWSKTSPNLPADSMSCFHDSGTGKNWRLYQVAETTHASNR